MIIRLKKHQCGTGLSGMVVSPKTTIGSIARRAGPWHEQLLLWINEPRANRSFRLSRLRAILKWQLNGYGVDDFDVDGPG